MNAGSGRGCPGKRRLPLLRRCGPSAVTLLEAVNASDVHAGNGARLGEALRMATEALDNEASLLRLIEPEAEQMLKALADAAEAQAQLLRKISRQHATDVDHYSNDS